MSFVNTGPSRANFFFVAAGTGHRFEDFTGDLAVWVVFYGPPGGEVPGQSVLVARISPAS